jgi:hypothetical protein
MLPTLLLTLACASAPDNGNRSRRSGPTAHDARDTAGSDTADVDTSETGRDDTGGSDSAGSDSGGDPSLAALYAGPLSFAFTHASYGAFACTGGSTFTLAVAQGTFTGEGSCEGPSLGAWTFSVEGTVEGGALVLGALVVDAEAWPCATHGTGTFEGTLTPTDGTLSATFVTAYTDCGQPYFWDGAIDVTLEAAP